MAALSSRRIERTVVSWPSVPFLPGLIGSRRLIAILKTAVPRASLGLWSPTAPSYRPTLQAALATAEKLGVELQTMSTADDIDVAFAAMSAANTGAFFVSPSSLSANAARRAGAEIGPAEHVRDRGQRGGGPVS